MLLSAAFRTTGQTIEASQVDQPGDHGDRCEPVNGYGAHALQALHAADLAKPGCRPDWRQSLDS
jgi:hypothetical protein